jgi:outer membrane lipoprotein-sorting protein
MVPIQRTVHKSLLFLLTTALLFLSMRVGAEPPTAEGLFQKLVQSFQVVDFEGRFIFMSRALRENRSIEALVLRKAPDKLRIELVEPPEVRGVAMVVSGEERWHVHEGGDRRRPPFPPLHLDPIGGSLLRHTQLLLQNYDVRVLAGGHVADRSTYLVELDPKVNGRPSVKIWVDAEMSIILKIEQYDSQKRPRGFFIYSEIDYEPDIDEAVFQRRNGIGDEREPHEGLGRQEIWNYNQGKLDLSEVRKEAQLDVILPDQTPLGFILQSVHIVKLGERRNVHLTYTDGLAILSVFQSLSDEGRRGGFPGDGFPGERRGGKPGGGRGGRPRQMPEDRPPWRQDEVKKMNIDGIECEVISRGPTLIFRWNYRGVYLTLMGELEQEEMAKFVSSFVSERG